jgi:hypothetical protein
MYLLEEPERSDNDAAPHLWVAIINFLCSVYSKKKIRQNYIENSNSKEPVLRLVPGSAVEGKIWRCLTLFCMPTALEKRFAQNVNCLTAPFSIL